MSRNAFAERPVRTMREWKSFMPTEQGLSVSSTTSVNADRYRIYQALTVPEYIEAWLSVPHAIEGRTGVLAGLNSISIGYCCAQDQQFRIVCSYQVRRRSKLVFTWQNFASVEGASSLVKIRLLGDFKRTTIHVTHVGLTVADQQWHERLWLSSLHKLSKLF
jgi:uncharacterized protein YndB with AHSA1/START domain